MPSKLCAECGTPFEPRSNRQAYCAECSTTTLRQRNTASKRKVRSAQRQAATAEWGEIAFPYANTRMVNGILTRPAVPWDPDGPRVPVGVWAGPGKGLTAATYTAAKRGPVRAVGGNDAGPVWAVSVRCRLKL